MLTEKNCIESIKLLCNGTKNPVEAHWSVAILEELTNKYFELVDKHKYLLDENARLNSLVIENNIQDMNYIMWRNNPPLKLEELKEHMWVWDKHMNRYNKIMFIYDDATIHFYDLLGSEDFKENRFFRKQVDE